MTNAMRLSDLTPDPANARKHSPRNVGAIEAALRDVGAARSIVIDEDGVILAGNATVQAAAAAGLESVRIIEADGDELIAVQRKGLSRKQKAKLALYDNRAAELADGWNTDVLKALQDDGLDLSGLWKDDELAALFPAGPGEWAAAIGGSVPSGDKSPFQQMTFTLSDDQAEQVAAAVDAAKAMGAFVDTGNENSNGNALARICETFLTVARQAEA